jgi:multicomponent Na+:H+ antiporter subunit D
MFGASFVAIFQDNLKRLFAYSSVGQIGYITLGLSFDSVNGLTASIVHLFNHGITKGSDLPADRRLVVAIAGRAPSRRRRLSIAWRDWPSACR